MKRDVRLSSISGGTDIISCFAGGNPIDQCGAARFKRARLAMKVEMFDDERTSGGGRRGDSCARRHFPACRSRSGTIRTAQSIAAAYFEIYPNAWTRRLGGADVAWRI